MSKFKEEITISITEHLQSERDKAIKKILDIVDVCHIEAKEKKKIRQVTLEEINNIYSSVCRVLTYIQED